VSTNPFLSFAHLVSRRELRAKGELVRFIGLDVHLDFCEIAICEEGRVRSAGRVVTSPEGLRILADSLGPDDQVALEATGNALAIARLLEPHVARVVVAATKELRAITEAKVKTDRHDARTLARLLAAGLLHGCWLPDEATRALGRRLARRAQLVRQRTRAKNEVHAVLLRNLKGRPPMTDVFGKRGRAWLAELELPGDERQTVDGCLRQIDFVDTEITILERAIADHALGSEDIKRLMTVPGVSLITAATFIAAVGDIRRFGDPRKLVSYLGLDPKIRQSGSSPARHGRISKQGAAQVRQMLTEAAFVAVSTPGPMRAFYERVRMRRGSQIAIVAVARKIAVLFWHLLTREQGYAFARPSLTRKKLRALELRAGAERHPGSRDLATKNTYSQRAHRERERELSEQAELAYGRLVADWQASGPAKVGAGATPGRASRGPSKGQAARQTP
jgi:transposase